MYYIGTNKRGKTLIIEARRNVDFLSCDIYDFWGQRETTKQSLKTKRYELLDYLKETKPDVYGTLKYAVVD